MNLLKTLNKPVTAEKTISEDGGAVGAGAVACNHGLLFGSNPTMIRRSILDFKQDYNKPAKKKKKKEVKESMVLPPNHPWWKLTPAERLKKQNEKTARDSSADAEVWHKGLKSATAAVQVEPITQKVKPHKEFKPKAVKEGARSLHLQSAFNTLREGGELDFDQSDVISKLKALENKEKSDIRDTVAFGVEDDSGAIVRITIRAEQAEDFEKALQAIMAEMEEDEDSKTEIAEVLYQLKDHFDIVDVVWPEVEEDEEVEGQEFGDEQGEPGGDGLEGLEDPEGGAGDMGGEPGEDGLDGLEDPAAPAEDAGGEVQGLLSQVIDMMKADAVARKADAEARTADAKAREQEIGAKASLAKIKQEEQFLDMEEHTKKQKEQDKEAKRLAQLSKWKRDMGGGDSSDDNMGMGLPPAGGALDQQQGGGYEEEERVHRQTSRISPADFASKLLGSIK